MARVIVLTVVLLLACVRDAVAAVPTLEWRSDAADIASACGAALDRLAMRTGSIGRDGSPRSRNVVTALENALADARDGLAVELFLWNVAQDERVRDASRACRLRFDQTLADTIADRHLYAAVVPYASARPSDALATAWQRAMQRGGATLANSRHDEYLRLAHEQLELEDRFWRNLANDRTTIRIDRRVARSLPPDLLVTFAQNRDGSYAVPVDEGTYDFLRYASNSDAREAYYRAFYRRAAAANVPLLERTIALRDRAAHLLGFESWADHRLATTTVQDLTQAQAFLRDAAAAYASARPPAAIAPWDLAYSSAPPPPVRSIDGILDAAAAPFGIRFARSTPSAWASDVACYSVTDVSTQHPIGTLCLDLYRRPGKYPQDAVGTILPPRSGRGAMVAIVASWPPQRDGFVGGDRAGELFADLGRALATLLAAVPYETLADVSREARELDAALLERLAPERAGVPSAREMLRAVAVANVDLAYHSSGSHVDTTAVWARIAPATFTQLYDPGTYPQVATDDFMDEWNVRLYTRPWSEAYAADIFAALAPDGRLDSQGGARLRRDVFAPSASRSLDRELRDLLGRDAKPVMP